ncbi:PREDICTED: pentatricopeptide repeat-containing protein At1g52640, mitochondrial-like [Camelina sativa]|uniref:Pentatricopeptide repeat-containing protein At1g52640, mitochondrial-like n=1 Tax=Camelina sativa TaxID=90675 RepID=A0ABM0X2U6_CAMSA|nr:PREDICTED: pentatricopeptide repeat-containing protein At1g52640, mitochondrial-like [Camelina sativa]
MAIRTFSSLIRALHQTPKPQSFRFFSTLLHDPPSPDLVNEISRVLSDHRNPKDDLEHTLVAYSPRVSSNLVEQVLKRCKNLGFTAHRFFLWARRIPDFEHSLESYHILVEILGSSKQFALLWDFLIEAREYNYFEISPKVFWIVFRAYSRANLPSEASRAFSRMIEFGIKPCVDDLDQLLHSLCDRKHVNHAQEFLDKAKVLGIVPTAKTYSILVRGWARIRDASGARKVFDEMLENNCVVDLLAYNALLDALCKSGDVDGAYKMLQEMGSLGLKPDAYSYAIFIHAYCDAGDVHNAYKVLDRMKRYELVPNVYTYNHIIKTLCKMEKVDDAYLLLDEMIQNGADPDTWTYNSMMAYHCDHCEVNRATKLLSRMDKTKCLPDRHTYNMVLKLLIRIGRFDRATEIWEGMSERKFYPTVATYTVMIHGLVRKKGKLEEACRYFEMMIDEGIPPYSTTVEMLRNRLVGWGQMDVVDVLAGKMERSSSCSVRDMAVEMRGRRRRSERRSEGSEDDDDFEIARVIREDTF